MAECKDSDIHYEFICSPCCDEGLNKEATRHCTTCDVYFCDGCIGFHNRVLKGHVVLDKDNFHARTDDAPTLIECCRKHGNKLVDMFCADDDVVGCTVCITLGHRNCSEIHYIPDISKGFKETIEYKETRDVVSEQHKQVYQMRESLTEQRERLTIEKDALLARIQKERLEINAILDKHEASVISRVLDQFNNNKSESDKSIEEIEKNVSIVTGVRDKLNQLAEMNDARAFVVVKQTKPAIDSVMTDNSDIATYYTGADEAVISMQIVQNVISDTCLSIQKFNIADCILVNGIYANKPGFQFNTFYHDDCIIHDAESNTIKRYGTGGRELAVLKLTDKPGGMCITSNGELAFTKPETKTVQFIGLQDGLNFSRSFSIDLEVSDIVSIEDMIVLVHSEHNSVGMYSMIGNLIKMVDKDTYGNDLFDQPFGLGNNHDKSNIYVFHQNSIVAIDCQGRYLRRLPIVNESSYLAAIGWMPIFDSNDLNGSVDADSSDNNEKPGQTRKLTGVVQLKGISSI